MKMENEDSLEEHVPVNENMNMMNATWTRTRLIKFT